MNAKSKNSKGNSLGVFSQIGTISSEPHLPPKTPIKRPPAQYQHSISATLSPLPFPPKLDACTQGIRFIPYKEMRYVETPPKHYPTIMPYYDHEGMSYVIDNPIIFESSGEDFQNNSSSIENSEEPEGNQSGVQNSENSQKDQIQFSENGRQLHEQGHQQATGQVKARRISKIKESSKFNKQSSDKRVLCNCKKTKCLKLYCDCFRLNQTCEGCNCVGCHNLQIYFEERNNAIMSLMDRNPDPFGQKIEDQKHVKGCNCKKSNCLKKYCECYQAGLKCGENCKCQECKNISLEKGGSEGDKGGVSKDTAKKERRMVEM